MLTEICGSHLFSVCTRSSNIFTVFRNYFLCFSFITGSYDRTCKVWDTASGEELRTLEGHRNVVFAIAFNNPYG